MLLMAAEAMTCHSCGSRSPEKAVKQLDSRFRGNDKLTGHYENSFTAYEQILYIEFFAEVVFQLVG
jgi:hypothetical protein